MRTGGGTIASSPLAAGGGLPIIAANHVIHLESHRNPAKKGVSGEVLPVADAIIRLRGDGLQDLR